MSPVETKVKMPVLRTTTTTGSRNRNNRKVARTHTPKPVCEHEDVTVLWIQEVHTDTEVMANRPDIIIKNRKEKMCILINVAITADRNVIQKEAQKKVKYRVSV